MDGPSFPRKHASYVREDTRLTRRDPRYASEDASYARGDPSYAKEDISCARRDPWYARRDASYARCNPWMPGVTDGTSVILERARLYLRECQLCQRVYQLCKKDSVTI